MVNWFAPGGEAAVALSVTFWLEPSGSVRLKLMESPGLGLAARATEIDAGEPDGPDTVAPVKLEFTPASLTPNGELAASSLIETVDAEGAGMSRRPSPLAPRSASCRSEIACLRPAAPPLPLRISSMPATEGWFAALPEKM